MVSSDFTSGRGDEEEGKIMFAGNFNIGFVTDLSRFDRAFELQVKFMTVRGSVEGIVEDGLVRGSELKDILKDKGSFSSRDTQRDVEG